MEKESRAEGPAHRRDRRALSRAFSPWLLQCVGPRALAWAGLWAGRWPSLAHFRDMLSGERHGFSENTRGDSLRAGGDCGVAGGDCLCRGGDCHRADGDGRRPGGDSRRAQARCGNPGARPHGACAFRAGWCIFPGRGHGSCIPWHGNNLNPSPKRLSLCRAKITFPEMKARSPSGRITSPPRRT